MESRVTPACYRRLVAKGVSTAGGGGRSRPVSRRIASGRRPHDSRLGRRRVLAGVVHARRVRQRCASRGAATRSMPKRGATAREWMLQQVARHDRRARPRIRVSSTPTLRCFAPSATIQTCASAPAGCCSTSWCRRSSASGSPPAKRSGNGTGCAASSASPLLAPHRSGLAAAAVAGRTCRSAGMVVPPAWRSRPSAPRRCAPSASTPRSCGRGRELPLAECAAKLELLPGVGPWTIGSVMASAMGDPDAVAVGDFHLKNLVSYSAGGRAARHRRAHARAARALCRPARSGRPTAAARRPQAARVRSPAAHPADGPLVIASPLLASRPAFPARRPPMTETLGPQHAAVDDTSATWYRILRKVGLVYIFSRLCVLAGAALVAAELQVDINQVKGMPDVPFADPAHRRAGRSRRPRWRRSVDVLSSWDGIWYMRHRSRRISPPCSRTRHLLRRRRPRRLLPGVPDAGQRSSTRCCPVATRSPRCSPTSCSAPSPSSCSACWPDSCTASRSPPRRWCSGRCSPAASCCRSPTPRRSCWCSRWAACGA